MYSKTADVFNVANIANNPRIETVSKKQFRREQMENFLRDKEKKQVTKFTDSNEDNAFMLQQFTGIKNVVPDSDGI